MNLSILVLNHNTRDALRQCLGSIERHPPPASFEVLVVDNASADDSAAMVRREFPGVSLIELRDNRGYASGNNVGLRCARGDFVLLMNPDVVVLDGGIESLHRVLAEHPEAGMAGPRLVYPDMAFQHSAFRTHRLSTPLYRRTPLGLTPAGRRELMRFLMLDWDHDVDAQVEWLMSSCVLVRRQALEAVGSFDQRFFLYFADADFCRRLWQAGWSVMYTPRSTFVHHHYRGSTRSLRLAGVHLLDFARYVWKWRGAGFPEPGRAGSPPAGGETDST